MTTPATTDQQAATTPVTEGQEPDATTTTTTATDEAATTTEASTTEEPSAEEAALPEWARKELTKVRGEAANTRVKLREAQALLTEAKTPEELKAAVDEVSKRNADLERQLVVSKVATEFKLPPELADALKGDDEAALKAHAKTLSKFVPAGSEQELKGGLDPLDADDSESDPRALAQKYGTRR